MIDFKNNGKIIDIIDNEKGNDIKSIILKTNIELLPFQFKEIDTDVTINCSELYDICHIMCEIDSNGKKDYYTYMESFTITKNDNNYKLILNIFNSLNDTQIIPEGIKIGEIHKSYRANDIIDINHATGINIYNDSEISVKSVDSKTKNFELITETDGENYLRIKLRD